MFPLLAATVIGIHYIPAFVHMVTTFKSCCQVLEVLYSQWKVFSFSEDLLILENLQCAMCLAKTQNPFKTGQKIISGFKVICNNKEQQQSWKLISKSLFSKNPTLSGRDQDKTARASFYSVHKWRKQCTEIMVQNLSVQREEMLLLRTPPTVVPWTSLGGGFGPHTVFIQSKHEEKVNNEEALASPRAAGRLTTDRKKNNEAKVMMHVKVWSRQLLQEVMTGTQNNILQAHVFCITSAQ